MKDRYMQIKERYDIRFNAWSKWLQEMNDDGIEWSSGSETTIIDQDTTNGSTTTGEDFPDTRIPTGTSTAGITRRRFCRQGNRSGISDPLRGTCAGFWRNP